MAGSSEERLASAVENLPILYDKSLKEFKDKNKKKNAWQQVAQQLGLESGTVAKRKFENLRARYSREKQRIKKAKKSGTSSAEVQSALREASDTFPYLHFLDRHIAPRATKSNLVEGREESDHEDADDVDVDDEDYESYMDTSSAASTVEDTESESTSPKAGPGDSSSASKEKKAKDLSTSSRKSKQSSSKVDMELEVIKAVSEGLKSMSYSMQQQPQAAKEEKDEDDLFGVYVASQLKCLDQSRKARAKYQINNVIYQVMVSGPSGDCSSGFMQDLNNSQGYYLG